MIITIDGPSASGKSTVSRLLAQQLEFYYINTGMLFRAIAYVLIQKSGFDIEQLSTLSEEKFSAIQGADFKYQYSPQGAVHISYKQEDITSFLKNQTIDKAASILGTSSVVRDFLMHYERTLAACHDVVIEGRDCGSVIFPDAPIKFFLTADVSERARRWQQDQFKKGMNIPIEDAIRIASERDERDTKRALAPLIKPHDAIVVDNTHLTIQETLEKMIKIIKERM